MVAGHLTLKNGRYYAVLNYRNAGGQRKTMGISKEEQEKIVSIIHRSRLN